ncbi:MAG: prohibitin family protein [Acidobacteriota bacterium]|nr:prohibitin family protein [Acidobacteriota bacterium]MDE3169933.1 prohibitin family protein [Acidobacteriota bacterium]
MTFITDIEKHQGPRRDSFWANPFGIAIAVIVAVIVLVLLFGSWATVPAGHRGVLITWGAASPNVLDPGLHFKLPLIQSIVIMNVQVQKNQIDEQAASLDLQDVETTVATNWNIFPSDASWVYQNVGTEDMLNDKILKPVVSNAVKAVTAHYNAEELVEKRDLVRGQIETQIRTGLKQYRINVDVDGVNITNFHFSQSYEQAIEQKQVAQQRAQQAQYELDQAKIDAERQVATAQGQAQAQKLLQQTLTPLIIQQQAIAKWDGQLPTVVGGNGVLPMIGNISGGSR